MNMDSPNPLDTLNPNIPSKLASTKSQVIEKPLPPPPLNSTKSEAQVSNTAASGSETSSHAARPSSSSGATFQRPRKRVTWRNKTCFVALPIDSENGRKTTREDYLNSKDVALRLQEWKNKGYDTRGFLLVSAGLDGRSCFSEGQSREIHPDSGDERRERFARAYRVKIPDDQEWEVYVNQLKEEKLRALGVSFTNEDLPRKSPAPSLMSRQASSQSSAMMISPALGPQPTHAVSYPSGFQAGSNHAPPLGKTGVSHFPRYSVAMPFGEKPLSPSNQFSQPTQSPVYGPWSPQQLLSSNPGSGVASPNTDGRLLNSLGMATSGLLPDQNNTGRIYQHDSDEALNPARRQQAFLPAPQLQHQLQPVSHSHPHNVARNTYEPHSQPLPTTFHRHTEIASPIPRGHRQNPSESLQKEIDEAEAYQQAPADQKLIQQDTAINQHTQYPAHQTLGTKGKESILVDMNRGDSNVGANQTHSVAPDVESHQNVPPRGHSSKASGSKLNVNAPVFKIEPKKSLESEIFAFLGNQATSNSHGDDASSMPVSLNQVNPASERPHLTTKLNVAAPEFTPGAIVSVPTAPSRQFSFSASLPSFRPDAPAFKPIGARVTSDSETSSLEKPVDRTKKIFGDVEFSEVIKPAKTSKAIPIISPEESPEHFEKRTVESDGQEDESGRITQADGRQKRMRRAIGDGDQVPLFATPNQTPWMNHEDDDRAAYFSSSPSPVIEKADASTLEAATDLLEEIIDDLSATEASDLMREDDSVSADGKAFAPHSFHDIDDAASFNAARPSVSSQEHTATHHEPTPDDVAKATIDFLDKSPQFGVDLDQALNRHASRSRSMSPRNLLQGEGIDRIDHAKQDIMDGVRYLEPSYNELNAIIKHLNEESDRGVEGRSRPFKHRNRSISPVRASAPEYHLSSRSPTRDSITDLYRTTRTPQLQPRPNIRSDAPSPSPNRLQGITQYLPRTDSESADTSAVEAIEQISRQIADNPRDSPSWPSKNVNPVNRLNSAGSTPPSDWNDAISSLDDDKFHSRTGFFDTHVNELVGSVVQQRLGPLEQALSGIQQSLAAMSTRSGSRRPRSAGTVEVVVSDADDEEDIEDLSRSRMKTSLTDPKFESLRLAINDITAAQQESVQAKHLAEVMEAVKELKASIPQAHPAQTDPGEIRAVIEEALGKQLRGRSAPVTSSSAAAVAEKSQLQIAGLESMLKVAENRADDEMKALRSTEDTLADNQRLLRSALQEAAEQRESAEATERTLEDFSKERQEMLQRNVILEGSEEHLRKNVSDLSDKTAALEDTLEEYRLSSDQWRTEIDDARHENKDLRRNISSLRAEIDEVNESRQGLRNKFSHLQEESSHVSQEVAADQLRWRSKEQQHVARLEIVSARLEAEAKTRERLELEIERLEVQEGEVTKARLAIEYTEKANSQLQHVITQLRAECHEHLKSTAHYRAISSEAEIAQGRRELIFQEEANSRRAALQAADDAKELALAEQHRLHQRTLRDIQEQHERGLKHSSEDKERSETYFGNRLNLADEKVSHYQDKIAHLEDKLEIVKSAAQAAVQAARNKNTVSSPVSSRAFRSIPKDSEIPEKVSPQALRESILVLQEQLQERESRIEQLESDLSAVDATAPARLKEADVEITWLRELLGVRVDDLKDIIKALSQPLYDREAVKDAVIRLKANLQMEQQEKERALAGRQNFPSIASISDLATSPRALPLAAAAAWGNWRKGREGSRDLNSAANGSVQQTPSKASPQSFFAGLMTPPSTNLRTTPPIAGSSRPLSSTLSHHAVLSPTTPRQGSDHRNNSRIQQAPVTPPLMRKASYDLDASENVTGFGDEGIEGNRMAGDDEEPFGPRLGGIVEML